ncbi:DUF5071 domain-containing protein [Leptospira sp. id769339]|uniref:DUF5071 domain-containing protein n=1 Tax=Leptospira sp. id769339 TaxID=2864221 RepID=UPI00214BC7A6|nr:DUF5071 domain-containing protein [Leptospira sp. id769339]MCR1795727.1 DUF5071 domain-containing protein [Leptospira sp. id769339]
MIPLTPDGDSKSKWEDQAKEIVSLDREYLLANLDDLLVWLMDINWPGSRRIADYLVGVGNPLIPHIKKVLASDDSGWIYFVIDRIISNWSEELVFEIKQELIDISKEFDYEGNFINALAILKKKNQISEHFFSEQIKEAKLKIESKEFFNAESKNGLLDDLHSLKDI